jgi:hypothetical protein
MRLHYSVRKLRCTTQGFDSLKRNVQYEILFLSFGVVNKI